MPITKESSITVSTLTIIKVVAALLGLWLLYTISDIVILTLVSLLLAASLTPWVEKMQRYHIPRSISMVVIYVVMSVVLAVAILLIVPPMANEIGSIATSFPALYQQVSTFLGEPAAFSPSALQNLTPAVAAATQGVFSLLAGFIGGLLSFLVVLVMTFYLVVDRESIKQMVAWAPMKYQPYAFGLITRLQVKIGIWFRAQLILMGVISAITYVFLLILGMPYALVLAIIAGIMEFIPYLGPVLAAVPAVFLAFSISPTMAALVACAYYVIQLLENNLIVPKIMERALGLSPIASILVFLIGGKLAGLPGSLLAIPLATAAMVVITDITNSRGRTLPPVT